ncbi:MAG: GNAT family N-acetyltransferase [Pseudolabrys sp.]
MIGFLRALLGGGEPVLTDASARDAAAIAALHGASFHRGWSEEEVERLLVDRQVVTHRAMVGATLAGFIMSRRAADEAEILSVAVAGRRRGRGLARRLLTLHLGRLAALGTRAVFLEVDENNVPALRLYRRAGFREVARRPNYYPGADGKPAAALVLRRDLG